MVQRSLRSVGLCLRETLRDRASIRSFERRLQATPDRLGEIRGVEQVIAARRFPSSLLIGAAVLRLASVGGAIRRVARRQRRCTGVALADPELRELRATERLQGIGVDAWIEYWGRVIKVTRHRQQRSDRPECPPDQVHRTPSEGRDGDERLPCTVGWRREIVKGRPKPSSGLRPSGTQTASTIATSHDLVPEPTTAPDIADLDRAAFPG